MSRYRSLFANIFPPNQRRNQVEVIHYDQTTASYVQSSTELKNQRPTENYQNSSAQKQPQTSYNQPESGSQYQNQSLTNDHPDDRGQYLEQTQESSNRYSENSINYQHQPQSPSINYPERSSQYEQTTNSYPDRAQTTNSYPDRAQTTNSYPDRAQTTNNYPDRAQTTNSYPDSAQTTNNYTDRNGRYRNNYPDTYQYEAQASNNYPERESRYQYQPHPSQYSSEQFQGNIYPQQQYQYTRSPEKTQPVPGSFPTYDRAHFGGKYISRKHGLDHSLDMKSANYKMPRMRKVTPQYKAEWSNSYFNPHEFSHQVERIEYDKTWTPRPFSYRVPHGVETKHEPDLVPGNTYSEDIILANEALGEFVDDLPEEYSNSGYEAPQTSSVPPQESSVTHESGGERQATKQESRVPEQGGAAPMEPSRTVVTEIPEPEREYDPPKPEFYPAPCPLCRLLISSRPEADMHWRGRRHKKTLRNTYKKLMEGDHLAFYREDTAKSAESQSDYKCDLCKMQFSGYIDFVKHNEGKKHAANSRFSARRNKAMAAVSDAGFSPEVVAEADKQLNQFENLVGSDDNLPTSFTSKGEYYCEECSITTNSIDAHRKHLTGTKHLTTIKQRLLVDNYFDGDTCKLCNSSFEPLEKKLDHANYHQNKSINFNPAAQRFRKKLKTESES